MWLPRFVDWPETGLEEINGDFLETDFWPGTVSGLLVNRKCTARRASPRTANTLTSLDPVPKMNAPATSVSHERPNHLALSHHREVGRRRDGRSIQSRGQQTRSLCWAEVFALRRDQRLSSC